MNNENNNFNNSNINEVNNQQLNTDNNYQNNSSNNNNKLPNIDKKKGIIIGGVVIAVLLLAIIVNSLGGGSHKNTTGIGNFTGKEIGLNCSKTSKGSNGGTTTEYVDVIFDYTSKKENGEDGSTYEARTNTKLVFEFTKELTSEDFKEIVEAADSSNKCEEINCNGNTIELGITEFGYDTTIEKKGNTVELKYYMVSGLGKKSNKKEIKDTFIDEGYTCK